MFLYLEYNRSTIYVSLKQGDIVTERKWVLYLDWSSANHRSLAKNKRRLEWHKYFTKTFTKRSEMYRTELRAIEEMIFHRKRVEEGNVLWGGLYSVTECKFKYHLPDANYVSDSLGVSMYLPMHVLKNVVLEFFDEIDKILMLKKVISTELQEINEAFFHDVVIFRDGLHKLLCVKSISEFSDCLRDKNHYINDELAPLDTTQYIVLHRILNVIKMNEDLIFTLPRPFDDRRISAYMCYEFMKVGYCMGEIKFSVFLQYCRYNSGQMQLLEELLTSVQRQYIDSHYWNQESSEFKDFYILANIHEKNPKIQTLTVILKQILKVDEYTNASLCQIISRHAGWYCAPILC